MKVGELVGLWRYPVKSMAAEALADAEVGWHGIAGDRRWAFIRPGLERSGFPWLTQRELAEMRRFSPRFVDPAHPDRSATVVRTPDGAEYDTTDASLAALLGDGVQVIRQDVGVFDSMPLSLISTHTVQSMSAPLHRELEPQRFRPNLLVELVGGDPFSEDAWLGRVLSIGSLRMRVDRRDPRCVIVTIDPRSGERDPQILRHIARERDGTAGVYGSVHTPGRVAVGDAVRLERDPGDA